MRESLFLEVFAFWPDGQEDCKMGSQPLSFWELLLFGIGRFCSLMAVLGLLIMGFSLLGFSRSALAIGIVPLVSWLSGVFVVRSVDSCLLSSYYRQTRARDHLGEMVMGLSGCLAGMICFEGFVPSLPVYLTGRPVSWLDLVICSIWLWSGRTLTLFCLS